MYMNNERFKNVRFWTTSPTWVPIGSRKRRGLRLSPRRKVFVLSLRYQYFSVYTIFNTNWWGYSCYVDEGKNKRRRSSETKSDKKERDSDRKHKSHKSSSTKGTLRYIMSLHPVLVLLLICFCNGGKLGFNLLSSIILV